MKCWKIAAAEVIHSFGFQDEIVFCDRYVFKDEIRVFLF